MSCLIVNMKEDGVHGQDNDQRQRRCQVETQTRVLLGCLLLRLCRCVLVRHPFFTSIFLVRALFIKGILRDSHPHLWAQGLAPSPFQWHPCFRAPLVQDYGCVSVLQVPSSSPSSLSHNLRIKSLLSFIVCLPGFSDRF